jgi:hypothetical protein
LVKTKKHKEVQLQQEQQEEALKLVQKWVQHLKQGEVIQVQEQADLQTNSFCKDKKAILNGFFILIVINFDCYKFSFC